LFTKSRQGRAHFGKPEGLVRVLVVEDDAVLRKLWIEVFRAAGHDVAGADSVGDARARLLARRCDVAVIDLHLGSESGLAVAMLAAFANPDCRVIMVTGSSLFANGELFDMAPTVSTVLRKPIAIEELLAVAEHGSVMV
jgi:two-component system response regulator RegA